MIVRDLDLVGITMPPLKADPPLIVDPDAVLAGTVAGKLLQAVPGRHAEVVESLGGIEDQQLAQRGTLYAGRPPAHRLSLEDLLRIPVPEALDHAV